MKFPFAVLYKTSEAGMAYDEGVLKAQASE